jgi:hypothetical protein
LLVRDTEIHQTEPVRVSLKNDVLSVDSFHIAAPTPTQTFMEQSVFHPGL